METSNNGTAWPDPTNGTAWWPASTDGDAAAGGGGSSSKHGTSAVIMAGAAVAACLFLLIGTTMVVCYFRGRRARTGDNSGGGCPDPDAASESVNRKISTDVPREYTYQELQKATNNFSTVIGRGAFGVVYKATLEDKKVIAVKQQYRKDVKNQFHNEVTILSDLRHKNVVKLEGYCFRPELLCYEYANGDNLDRWLIQSGSGRKLTWEERLHILHGVCKGLEYLQNGAKDRPIMHMDLKTDNILLQIKEEQQDDDGGRRVITPKISDFGISRNLQTDDQHEYINMQSSIMNNTVMPPEMERGKVSPKSDIYSFGILILTMVTAKTITIMPASHKSDSRSYGEWLIQEVRQHWDHWDKDIDRIKDASLDARCNDGIEKCIEIAMKCVDKDLKLRPHIANIICSLDNIAQSK